MQIQAIVAFVAMSSVPALGHPAGPVGDSLELVDRAPARSKAFESPSGRPEGRPLVSIGEILDLDDFFPGAFEDGLGLVERGPKVKCPKNTGAGKVSYSPTKNKSKVKTFTVRVQKAIAEMEAAGFTAGASGDPHHFEAKKDPRTGQKEITWGVANCDSDAAVLMEYPVYWENAPGGVTSWQKDARTSQQRLNTPLRVVYAVKEGCQIFCGVMGHSVVEADFSGKDKFIKLS